MQTFHPLQNETKQAYWERKKIDGHKVPKSVFPRTNEWITHTSLRKKKSVSHKIKIWIHYLHLSFLEKFIHSVWGLFADEHLADGLLTERLHRLSPFFFYRVFDFTDEGGRRWEAVARGVGRRRALTSLCHATPPVIYSSTSFCCVTSNSQAMYGRFFKH